MVSLTRSSARHVHPAALVSEKQWRRVTLVRLEALTTKLALSRRTNACCVKRGRCVSIRDKHSHWNAHQGNTAVAKAICSVARVSPALTAAALEQARAWSVPMTGPPAFARLPQSRHVMPRSVPPAPLGTFAQVDQSPPALKVKPPGQAGVPVSRIAVTGQHTYFP